MVTMYFLLCHPRTFLIRRRKARFATNTSQSPDAFPIRRVAVGLGPDWRGVMQPVAEFSVASKLTGSSDSVASNWRAERKKVRGRQAGS